MSDIFSARECGMSARSGAAPRRKYERNAQIWVYGLFCVLTLHHDHMLEHRELLELYSPSHVRRFLPQCLHLILSRHFCLSHGLIIMSLLLSRLYTSRLYPGIFYSPTHLLKSIVFSTLLNPQHGSSATSSNADTACRIIISAT